MKKLTTTLTITLASLWILSSAHALPSYYTFDGTVTSIDNDEAGIVAASNFTVGSSVTYTILSDFQAEGSKTQMDETVVAMPNNIYNSALDGWDRWYIDFISGTRLFQSNGGYFNASTDIGEYNYGSEERHGLGSTVGRSTHLYTGADDYKLDIWDKYSWSPGGVSFISWYEGMTLYGSNTAYNNDGTYSKISFTLTLTEISSTIPDGMEIPEAFSAENEDPQPAPVPEPASIVLFLAGILGIAKRKLFK